MYSANDVRWMSRERLTTMLEEAGFKVYDHESDTELENALIEHLETEGLLDDDYT